MLKSYTSQRTTREHTWIRIMLHPEKRAFHIGCPVWAEGSRLHSTGRAHWWDSVMGVRDHQVVRRRRKGSFRRVSPWEFGHKVKKIWGWDDNMWGISINEWVMKVANSLWKQGLGCPKQQQAQANSISAGFQGYFLVTSRCFVVQHRWNHWNSHSQRQKIGCLDKWTWASPLWHPKRAYSQSQKTCKSDLLDLLDLAGFPDYNTKLGSLHWWQPMAVGRAQNSEAVWGGRHAESHDLLGFSYIFFLS